VELLKDRLVGDDPRRPAVIRPDRKYRREVSMIEERLLQHLVSCVYDGSTDVYPLVETILGLMKTFQMDPFHSHCEAAVYVAAREGRWQDAVKIYQNYRVDAETTPPPTEDPTMGLYCIARHAKNAGALPVESVLDAVAKLAINGGGTEKCTWSCALCWYKYLTVGCVVYRRTRGRCGVGSLGRMGRYPKLSQNELYCEPIWTGTVLRRYFSVIAVVVGVSVSSLAPLCLYCSCCCC
jgi:hypothetical protein